MADSVSYAIQTRYVADLAGQYEVPPVNTGGRGSAMFRRVGRDRLRYTLEVSGLQDITEAHIHQGKPGRNGPVVAWLFGPSRGTTISGLLARGTLRKADLVGPLRGKSIGALVRQMKAGNTYTNVHTTRYPDGEIRGQIRRVRNAMESPGADWWRYGSMTLS